MGREDPCPTRESKDSARGAILDHIPYKNVARRKQEYPNGVRFTTGAITQRQCPTRIKLPWELDNENMVVQVLPSLTQVTRIQFQSFPYLFHLQFHGLLSRVL